VRVRVGSENRIETHR